MKNNYSMTIKAAYLGYVVQAIVNNFVPLLFVRLQLEFGIPLGRITLLITVNFCLQLLVDMFSTPFIERIGYRLSMILSNAFVIIGFVMLAVLPKNETNAFVVLLICVCIYAIGGGLQEVLVSPIVEACPTEHKETQMSLLHSAYCWGYMAVVLLSTMFFALVGISNWRVLALLWCIVPAIDLILFTYVPIAKLKTNTAEEGTGFKELASQGIFWLMFLMMLCAGASEQAVSQWASVFAEKGLGVTKILGDILGPMLFALCMALSRTFYGLKGRNINLNAFMGISTGLCIAAYLIIVFTKNPVIALLGCGLAGFSVGIFWPGTFSTASAMVKGRGTLMFALLALAGDVGCLSGPTLAGGVLSLTDDNIRMGIGVACVFPLLMGVGLLILRRLRHLSA